MATLSKLVVSLQANSAKLMEGLKGSKSAIGQFVADAKKKAATMKKAFQPVVTVIKTITKAALAGVGAVTGFVTALALKANGIKNLQTTAQAIGIGTTALQEWRYAAQQVGVESDKMGDIFKDVSDKLGDFLVTGGGGAADLFEKLKIDARDFIGLSPDQALLKIGKAIEPLTQQEKIFFLEAIASDASLLLPLLENNAAGFRKFAEEAKKAGLVLKGNQIASATAFSNAVNSLLDVVSGFWGQFTATLAGPLSVFTNEIKNWVDEFGGVERVAKSAALFVLDMIETGIVTGAKFIKWVSNIGSEFTKLKIKIKEAELSIREFFLSIAPHKWLGEDVLNIEFTPTVGELDVDRVKHQIEQLKAELSPDFSNKSSRKQNEKSTPLDVNNLIHNAFANIDTNTGDTEARSPLSRQDAFVKGARELVSRMRESLDRPVSSNTDATKSQTGATKANTSALQKQLEALKRYEANKAEKDNPKNDIGKLGNGSTGKVNTDYIFRRAMDDSLKSSQIFENAARRFADSIKSGSVTPDYATLSIQNLRNIVATLQLDNVRYGGENFDTEGMRTVIDQLTELARDRISGSNKPPTLADYQAMFQRAAEDNKSAQELAANTVAEAIRKASADEVKATQEIVNRAPSSERSLGSININMMGADGKTLSGMIWGEPDFLRRLQAFNNQNTRNQTRAAVR